MDIRPYRGEPDRVTAAELRVAATQALSRRCAECRRVLRNQLIDEEFRADA
jgi:hypothetical protein